MYFTREAQIEPEKTDAANNGGKATASAEHLSEHEPNVLTSVFGGGAKGAAASNEAWNLMRSPALSRRSNAGLRVIALSRAQQTQGNRYTQRLVSQIQLSSNRSRLIQRDCACGGICAKCSGKPAESLTAAPAITDESQPSVQAQASGSTLTTGPGDREVIPPRTNGQPLNKATQSFMGSRLGADFSDVRVHSDHAAVDSAEALGANAYTTGRDIYFAAGKYSPETLEGQHLLAHELTHVVQQNSAAAPDAHTASEESSGMQPNANATAAISEPADPDERQAEKIAEQVTSQSPINAAEITPVDSHSIQRQEGIALLGAAYQSAVLIGMSSSYELKGNGEFDPNIFLRTYIDDRGGNALVNVNFGNLAKGKLYVTKTSSGDYTAGPSALPMVHSEISPPGGGQSLSLVVSIGRGNEITGSVGVTEPLPPNSIGAAYGSPEDQQRFLGLLIGGTASHGKVENTKVQNELKDGHLNFWYVFTNHLNRGTFLVGVASLVDESFAFLGKLHTEGKGMIPADTEIKRDKTGDLIGKLQVRTDWEAKGFKGSLALTYEEGVLEIRGALKYDSPRVKGELNVLATEEGRAWKAIEGQLASLQPVDSGKSAGAPPAGGGSAGTSGTGDRLALTGWGVLKFVVTDKIDADAAFVVDPDGYLTVRGTIRSAHQITLMDAKPTKEKTFFDKDYSEMVYVFWASGVRARAHVKLTAGAVFGPLTLHGITITGVYSTRPDAGSEIEISAKLNLSASAKARLEAEGELAARLGTKYSYLGVSVASVALNLSAEAEVRGVVEAQPTIKRQTKGSGSADDKPKYIIAGELFIGGEIDLTFNADLIFQAGPKVIHEIHLGDKVFPIAGFGLTTNVSYTLGSDETPEVEYKKGNFEPARFIRQVVQEKPPKDKPNEVTGGFKEDGKEKGKVGTGEIPDQPPTTPKTQVIQFTMDARAHSLFLTLGAPGEPVSLEMASKRGPIKSKISRAEADLIVIAATETDETARKKLSRRLDDLVQASRDADRVEMAASKLGIEPEATQMDVPGLKELGGELQDYGERYKVTDLAEPAAGTTPPTVPAPSTGGPGTDPDAEEVMAAWTDLQKDQEVIDQVRRILNTGNLAKTQFAEIMNKAKGKTAGRRFLSKLEQLAVRNVSGTKVVLADLEIGGNKFYGADFMLSYIEDNGLWGSVTQFEATMDDRRIDAVIVKTQYEFKSWTDFYVPTFLEQIGKDYARNELRGVRWVFQRRLAKGDRDAIIKLMEDALNDKELTRKYNIKRLDVPNIIAALDRVVIVY